MHTAKSGLGGYFGLISSHQSPHFLVRKYPAIRFMPYAYLFYFNKPKPPYKPTNYLFHPLLPA